MFKTTITILLFLPFFLYSQYSKKQIDSLLFIKVKHLRSDGLYEEVITLSKEIIANSKKLNYKRGEAWGYARLGNALCTLGKYKESLDDLNKAKALSESIDDDLLKSVIAIETGRNYNESKISVNQAIEQFKTAEKFAKKIDDKYDRETYLLYAYQNLLSSYANLNREDLAIIYARKSLKIEEDAYSLSYITHYHINTTRKKDSIEFYLNRSTSFLDKLTSYEFEKSILYNQWGKYYEGNRQYKPAIDSYKKAEKYGKESKAFDEVLIAYSGLSRCYETLSDLKETVNYERMFSRLQDSITKAKNKNVSSTIDHIVQDKEQNILQRLSSFQRIMIICVIVALGIILFLGFRMRKSQILRKRSKEILQQKDKETQELKLKVNESFDEVIQLAKTNSPEFWGRFQEVYPDFRTQLLSINPELKPSELILSAYIYLGFTTKDIADYTFKAVKTIKNNKYNLRKRLDIPTENDLTIWMRDFIK